MYNMSNEVYAAPNIKFYASQGAVVYGFDNTADVANGFQVVDEGLTSVIMRFQQNARFGRSLVQDPSYATCVDGVTTILKPGVYAITVVAALDVDGNSTYKYRINWTPTRAPARDVASLIGTYVRYGNDVEDSISNITWTGFLNTGDELRVYYDHIATSTGQPTVITGLSNMVLSLLY